MLAFLLDPLEGQVKAAQISTFSSLEYMDVTSWQKWVVRCVKKFRTLTKRELKGGGVPGFSNCKLVQTQDSLQVESKGWLSDGGVDVTWSKCGLRL